MSDWMEVIEIDMINSLPMLNSGTFQSVAKTTSARYIACRRFAN